MSSREDLDADDDFSELYKEYTGPLGSVATNTQETPTSYKRPNTGSDEEDEAPDPNAVPTDFTSREAKVWEAKSKATERNWKKRKEEEMICKICGESGHFTQGCPSTLGANRKSQDFFERVPAREPHVKALFSENVVIKIEKDIGCKIKIEEKFIIVSGKDRLILRKGVDAVHKIKEEWDGKGGHRFPEDVECKGSSSFPVSRSRSPERRSPATPRLGRSDSQMSNISPRKGPHITNKYSRPDKVVKSHVLDDQPKLSGGSPQAYGNHGVRGRSSSLSKSPARPSYLGNSFNSYELNGQGIGGYRADGINTDGVGSDIQPDHHFEYPSFPQTLEELEAQFKSEVMELARIRNKEEDEENYKHHEAVREMRDSYMRTVAMIQGTHAKMWEDFLQQEGQKKQQARQHVTSSGFGGYKQSNFPEFDNSHGNIHHSGTNIPMDSRGRYSSAIDACPSSRAHDSYGDFHRRRSDGFERAHNRY